MIEEKNDQTNENKEEPILKCPHCDEYVIIEKLNCGIFRHGIFVNGKEMNPHTPKNLCEEFVKQKIIYGCGKPFRIFKDENKYNIEICDYI